MVHIKSVGTQRFYSVVASGNDAPPEWSWMDESSFNSRMAEVIAIGNEARAEANANRKRGSAKAAAEVYSRWNSRG